MQLQELLEAIKEIRAAQSSTNEGGFVVLADAQTARWTELFRAFFVVGGDHRHDDDLLFLVVSDAAAAGGAGGAG